MKKVLYISLIFFGLFSLSGETVTDGFSQRVSSGLNYDVWAEILKIYVDDKGRVNYIALKKDRADLDTFIESIENVDLSDLSPNDRKAFWINAYNALTIQTIIDNYPVKSIRYINFGLVWKIGKKVAGGKHSLGDIEHQILRPMGDPRVHFALNCASAGCPKLPNEPFYPSQLDEQLERETKRFINDETKVRLDKATNTLFHSELFNWYEKDFLLVASDKLSYIKNYINDDDKKYLESQKVTLKKIKYDWGLNEQ